jgi:NAD(P)-dependent dehydrogenase (short-subunit alcohol dehydrogenase family)
LLQGCLPLLRAAQGRIVWITTPALLPIPYVASIHVPDFAINCLVRTLNLELSRWHIPAIMIRCGTIQTAAPERTARELEAAMASWPPERLDLYREALLAEQRKLARLDRQRTSPDEVARMIEAALVAARPKLRYRVGRLSGMAAAFELLPQPLVDFVMARGG